MVTVSCPSLEDLLSHRGLQRKNLESVCPQEVRDRIALKLEDWKMVGRCLNFPPEKLKAIDRENETEDQRRVALLDDWGKREGKGATYLKLAEVLHQRGRGDLVEVLCDELRKSPIVPQAEHAISTSNESKEFFATEDIGSTPAAVINTTERIEALENQFDSLHQQLMSEVTQDEALSGMELLRALTMLPVSLRKEYESSIQQMLPTLEGKNTITELFLRLSPLFVFIDYGLLDHLISKFGSPALKGEMKSYVSKVKAFMKETTVGDLMDYWPGEKDPRMNYSELKAKFSDDPRLYTLERLNDFRRKFCCKIRLSEFIFGLILLEAGESFYATWLVPAIVAPELKKAIDEIDESFYHDEHVLMFSLDLEILYPSEKDLVIPKANKQKIDMPNIPEEGASVYYSSRDSLPPVAPHCEMNKNQDHSRMEGEETLIFKAIMNENVMLKAKLESCRKDKEIMIELTSSMSEKILRLEELLQDSTDLKEANSDLQEMKTKLHDATLQLRISVTEASKFDLERENMYIDTKPTILDLLEKQQRLKEWVLDSSSIPPSVLPSDSGLDTSIVGEGSEPSEDFEQQFFQELAMKQEELRKKEEVQQKLLGDLAMMQGELVRNEEEMERLRVALEEANIDKSKVYSENLGQAEQFERAIHELEKMLRTKNEEVNGLICELQHLWIQMEKRNEQEFYRMDKTPHGICVIINNHMFYDPTDPDKAPRIRRGAEVDQKNLKLTFEYLRYKVEIYENLSHTQMQELMLSMAQRNHAEYDSFVCCIMTHGKENIVHGADSIPVSVLDLMRVMKMCKTLVNKPKMFFIQADRGDQEEKGHRLDEEEAAQQDSRDKQPPYMHTIPQEADFFFGYATPLGNPAYRNRHHGSWYISELCKMLTRHAYTSNLNNMMRMVNDSICQAFTKDGYKQTAEFVDRLRKGVHFFHFSKVQQ